MIFECATVWSRPHNLDISPPAITCRYHTWPRQTRLQIPGIVQWVGYIPIQTLCLHLFLTKIYTKWKQIVSDYFSHSQYLQFSDLRAHTHFSSQKNYSLCHDSSDMFILRLLADTRYFAVARCTTILQLIIGDFFAIGCCDCWPRSLCKNLPSSVARTPLGSLPHSWQLALDFWQIHKNCAHEKTKHRILLPDILQSNLI